jgi:pyruvate/2-oxoacid:ferredoxin oxidoreductase beta subunit
VTHPPRDLTPLPDLLHGAARAGPVRTRRPVYLDLLPPCNAGCRAGENIQAWLGFSQAYRAVASGYWPLMRYDPIVRAEGGNPFLLDSPRPGIALPDYTGRELRYRILAQAGPAEAERLLGLAQQEVIRRWATYEEMATQGAERFPPSAHRSNA